MERNRNENHSKVWKVSNTYRIFMSQVSNTIVMLHILLCHIMHSECCAIFTFCALSNLSIIATKLKFRASHCSILLSSQELYQNTIIQAYLVKYKKLSDIITFQMISTSGFSMKTCTHDCQWLPNTWFLHQCKRHSWNASFVMLGCYLLVSVIGRPRNWKSVWSIF